MSVLAVLSSIAVPAPQVNDQVTVNVKKQKAAFATLLFVFNTKI